MKANQPITLSSQELSMICSSRRWQQTMSQYQPFQDRNQFFHCADIAFDELEEEDWLEAFAGHPMIGDIDSLAKKYAHSQSLSENEQKRVQDASSDTLEEVLQLNLDYKDTFGFIFIVCATNQSAQSMLAKLEERLPNSREQELVNAATEQRKISKIRMESYV